MTSLAIHGIQDSPGKKDGRYFGALARRWQSKHGGVVVGIDLTLPKAKRFRDVVSAIEQHAPTVLAIFDHGLSDCLPRLGVCSQARPKLQMPERNVDVFAGAIAAGASAPRVVLFACLAGEDLIRGAEGPPGGDFGLADQMRDSLVKHGAFGCQVDAHGSSSQAAHRLRDYGGDAVSNPFVRRFSGPETKTAIGGYWLVEPGSPLWRRWDAALDAGFWLEFPWLTPAQIEARLSEAA